MRKIIIVLILSIIIPCSGFATTYYVNGTTGDDADNGTTDDLAKLTIQAGIGLLSANDTLIIADGTYTGASNLITAYAIPSGTGGDYTTIQAETDFGVIINDVDPGYGGAVNIKDKEYIIIRGIVVTNLQTIYNNAFATDSTDTGSFHTNHIKFIRCGSDGTKTGSVAGAFQINDSEYCLVEECFAFGHGRYPFIVGDGTTGADQDANYNVFRRCVQRWDYSNNVEVMASFAIYAQQHGAWQNCIAIDGLDIRGTEHVYDGIKGFFTPNGAENDIQVDGCIVLNYEGAGYWFEQPPVIDVTLNNSIAWDIKDGNTGSTDGYPALPLAVEYDADGGPVAVTNCTFGESDHSAEAIVFDRFGTVPNESIKNSIIMNMTLDEGVYALAGTIATYDYNNFYNNTDGRNKDGGIGANSITTDPESNGLLYLPRIELGSTNKTAGESGGQIGAEIMYQIGRDAEGDGICGLVWGETGWDELQDGSGDSNVRPLWPWANEDTIKTFMAAFSMAANEAYTGSPAMTGARGFATAGSQTLTNYIWGYLGNASPYAGGSIAVTGTLLTNNDEADVVTGGFTLIGTASGTEFVATAGDDNAITTAIIQGLAGSASWNTCMDSQDYNDLVCTSTVCTLTLDACGAYAIDSNDILTWTFPTTAVVSETEIVAVPTVEIIAQSPLSPPPAVSNLDAGSLTVQFYDDESGELSVTLYE